MTTQILTEKPTLILKDGTLVKIDEQFGLIWFYPNPPQHAGSFRLNLKLKMVDVIEGEQKQWTE